MKLSLRQLARSRRLRAMGVLAWLMLVVNVVAAAPMGMHAMAGADAMEATSAVIDVHCHDAASMPMAAGNNAGRSEERRVGKKWVSTCRSRGWPLHTKKKTQTHH